MPRLDTEPSSSSWLAHSALVPYVSRRERVDAELDLSRSLSPLGNAWAAMNVASDTARAAALGYVVMLGNCGGLISTWSFLSSDAPNYP